MKSLFSMLIFCLLCSGCGETEESPIISVDPIVCLNQTSMNIALWNYMDDWYLWNESLDHSTVLDDFSSLEGVINNIKENNPVDRYSFVMTKADYDDLFINATNVSSLCV